MIVKNWKESFNWKHLQTNQSRIGKRVPSRELTYPTLGRGKSSSSKCYFWWDMLIPWRVAFCIGWEMVGFASTFRHDLIREPSSSRVLQLIKAVTSIFWTFWFSWMNWSALFDHSKSCNWSITYVHPSVFCLLLSSSFRSVRSWSPDEWMSSESTLGALGMEGTPSISREVHLHFVLGLTYPKKRIPVIFKVGWI